MKHFPLDGDWLLRCMADGSERPGRLPGCNYTDLWKNGEMPDPYAGKNEYAVQDVARRDYVYLREFDLPEDFLLEDGTDLVLSGVDCLAEITLNGRTVAHTDNAHRTYRLPVRDFLSAGKNEIAIEFKAPLTEAERLNEKRKIPQFAMSEPGAAQLRKAICHFGWDWGPVIAFSGVTGELRLEAYSRRWEDLRVMQEHRDGIVALDVTAELQRDAALVQRASNARPYTAQLRLIVTAPDGTEYTASAEIKDSAANAKIVIENPELWWCNGLGEQPLYTVRAELCADGKVCDTWEKQIGLRTIELDTAPDKWGTQFRFIVNGVPIFAKGANWIPYDFMPSRHGRQQERALTSIESEDTTPRQNASTESGQLEYLLQSAKAANMNMLRVWGGGYYESDEFYRLCDENGLLVWQDCAFACALYPLDEPEYLENVHAEIIDNVRRLRHHASLALWCGNNEIQYASWGYTPYKKLMDTHNRFFFEALKQWINGSDGVTAYWPSSPCSGDSPKNPRDLNRGDTHLWHVWHGCKAVESYRDKPTRFCSEYGMESFPARATLESFIESPEDMRLLSPVMLSHQKCRSGNVKMRYYILSKFREPRDFGDFCTLSQIMQAEAMRHAADFWRCNMGRCNGSLYWQYNDCWPTASWAGLDYFGRWKALQYRARHFNAPLSAVALLDGSRNLKNGVPAYVINETKENFYGSLRWRFVGLDGNAFPGGEVPVKADAARSTPLGNIIDGRPADLRGCALILELLDANGDCVHTQHYLLADEKHAKLLPPDIRVTEVSEIDGRAYFTLSAKNYARFVQLDIPGIDTPFSDNFFDIPGGESVTVSIEIPEGKTAGELADNLQIRSVADIPWVGSPLRDKFARLGILLNLGTHKFRNYPLREWECR